MPCCQKMDILVVFALAGLGFLHSSHLLALFGSDVPDEAECDPRAHGDDGGDQKLKKGMSFDMPLKIWIKR